MYETFEEAREAAIEIINKANGAVRGCCVTENKLRKNSKSTFGFRFYEKDSNGEFVKNEDGSYTRLTAI